VERRKTPFLAQRARELRKESSATEQRLWKRIRNRQVRGYRFRRRPIVLGKIPDFACPEAQLAIEIDGYVYATSAKTKRDRVRDSYFLRHSITTLHISSALIWADIDAAVQLVSAALPSTPSMSGRGHPRSTIIKMKSAIRSAEEF